MKGKTILSIFCLLITECLGAQQQEAADDYLAQASGYASIYNGKEGYSYPRYILNHPYWGDAGDYRQGSLSYDGIMYTNVWMRLDLYRDELLVRSPDRRFEIALYAGLMDYAVAEPYYIARLDGEKDGGGRDLPEGYYIRLYDGRCQVWKRETKHLTQSRNEYSGLVDTYFERRVIFYVRMEGVYHAVRNEASLLRLFPSGGKEIKRYMRRRKLSFRKAPETVIVDIVRRYEHLSEGI
ncbi:MAG: hypothetical protein LBI58_01140 [Tannerellaceae bacterium]|nr:hypothetical protein [Tannerellaceae bacterium]